jgi:Ion channel.
LTDSTGDPVQRPPETAVVSGDGDDPAVPVGGMMYVIEGPEHGFTTLPVSVYWAVVTMTTVGYGDITPHTTAGRVLASLLILTGYSMIAIPTGVMSAYMTEIMQRRRRYLRCPSCQNTEHIDNARFCQRCGASLNNNTAPRR